MQLNFPSRAGIRGWLLLLLLGFWALALYQLTIFPPVTEDEPWIASTGWQLATRGVFGSPLFAGLWQMDQRYYDFMPLYPLLSSVLYRGAGVGVFQARFVSVALGCLVLALTFALGRRLFNARVGLLAVLVALALPLTIRGDTTGSLLLDLSRLARYDVLVPVMELAACLAFLNARAKHSRGEFLLAGIFAGLAGLAHVYGALIVVPLVVFILWERLSRSALIVFGAGVFIPAGAYALYVAGGWDAFRNQTQWYGERFDLFDPSWYRANLANETQRYLFVSPLLGNLFWIIALLALAVLAYAALRQRRFGARFLLVTVTVYGAAFAFLFESKLPNYLAGGLPFFALTVAFAADTLLQRVPHGQRFIAQGAALLAVLLLLWQGLALNAAQARTSSYAALITQLREAIPAGAHVLGLHSYWLGMDDYTMRDWIVPLQWSTAQGMHMSMTAALERVSPDVVVIDPRIRPFLANTATDPRAAQVAVWLQDEHFTCTAQFDNKSYGTFQIFRRNTAVKGTPTCSTR